MSRDQSPFVAIKRVARIGRLIMSRVLLASASTGHSFPHITSVKRRLFWRVKTKEKAFHAYDR
jgi:hypothetical protein